MMSATEDQPRRPLLVTIEEAATLLGVGRTTVYELLAEAELVSVQIHRCRRIALAELEAYVSRLRGAGAESV
jgi:excisionase family DNA binding protein